MAFTISKTNVGIYPGKYYQQPIMKCSLVDDLPGNFHFGALFWRHGTSCRLGWWMHGEGVEERWWWRLEAKDYWYGRLWLQFVGAHADFVVVVDDDVLHAVHVLHCMTLMLALLLLWRLLLFQPAMVIIRNSKQSITKYGWSNWLASYLVFSTCYLFLFFSFLEPLDSSNNQHACMWHKLIHSSIIQ